MLLVSVNTGDILKHSFLLYCIVLGRRNDISFVSGWLLLPDDLCCRGHGPRILPCLVISQAGISGHWVLTLVHSLEFFYTGCPCEYIAAQNPGNIVGILSIPVCVPPKMVSSPLVHV